jgi:hypothetical protein
MLSLRGHSLDEIGPNAPFADMGLSRAADEMHEEHRRRVLGE